MVYPLIVSLRQEVVQAAQQTSRFLKQMALNALTRGVALNWRGAIMRQGPNQSAQKSTTIGKSLLANCVCFNK
jgi:hypothetical protein